MTTQDKHAHLTLKASVRTIIGKKVKKLRREGIIPANIFGPDIKSQSISIDHKDFLKIFRQAKETGVIYITVDKGELPVLTRSVHRHPVSDMILHVDFRKVDLKQKIEASVPIKVMGEAPAVSEKSGVLILQHDHLQVESLPEDLPAEIEIDISGLTEIGAEVKVGDLKKSGNFEIKDEPEKLILSITAHKEESLEPEVAVEAEAEGEEAPAAEGEAAEGEQGEKSEGEAEKSEGDKKEEESKEENKE